MNLIKCDSRKTKTLGFEGEKSQVLIFNLPCLLYPLHIYLLTTATHNTHLFVHPHTHSLAHMKRRRSGRHLISSIIPVAVVINVKWFLFTTQIPRVDR